MKKFKLVEIAFILSLKFVFVTYHKNRLFTSDIHYSWIGNDFESVISVIKVNTFSQEIRSLKILIVEFLRNESDLAILIFIPESPIFNLNV